MNSMSEEQAHISNQIKTNHNIIVDAIAGSGKSTTILSIAVNHPELSLLQMTYNAMLRHEVNEKAKSLNIQNIKVHTFHSLAVRYYMSSAYTDTAIRHILYNNTQPTTKIAPFNILVIDEAQDMTFLYFQFMMKFTKDMGEPFQLLVLGDYKQGLYEFKGADTRFLTMADDIWKPHPQLLSKTFLRCSLKTSYRITKPMAHFVNEVMLGEHRMFSEKEGEPVHYYRQSHRNTEKFIVSQIKNQLENGAKPSDFFVLGASVKGVKSNIRKIENALVENNIPCHVPMIEGESIDEKVIDGKVVFSTFHSVKGRQRKYVFVVGFDNSYYYNATNASRTICPNTLYVGATRASAAMYLLEKNDYNTDRPLEFLKMSHIEMKQRLWIDFKGIPQTIFYERVDKQSQDTQLIPRHNITPTDLIKFIPESVIEDITPLLDKIFVKKHVLEPSEIDLPTVIKTKNGYYEDVSDLNGIAIPAIYYNHMYKRFKKDTNENILLDMIKMNMADTHDNDYRYLKEVIKNMPEKCSRISDYLYAANVYVATQEKLYFKLKQIDREEYDWLKRDTMIQCLKRLDLHVMSECKHKIPIFEKVLIDYSMDEEHTLLNEHLRPFFEKPVEFRFSGRLDLVTEKTVWELKCTSKISIDHMLQVVIYAWLWKLLVSDERNIRILNIKTGEVLELQATNDELTLIMVSLLKGKYCEPVVKTNEEFVADCCKNY
jgi:hypothetical protein